MMYDGPVLLRAVLLLQVIRFFSHDQKASQRQFTENSRCCDLYFLPSPHFSESVPAGCDTRPSPRMTPALCSSIQAEVISGEPGPMGGSGEKHIKVSGGF